MRTKTMIHSYKLLFCVLLSLSYSCGPAEKQRTPIYKDLWNITGKVTSPDYKNGEIIALSPTGKMYRSKISDHNSFGITLPGNTTYAVHFRASQPLTEDTTRLFPILTFEDSEALGFRHTLRLPKVLFNSDLSLGEIDIKETRAFPTINPFSELDFDGDGINDYYDLDDQNDGLNDALQNSNYQQVMICHKQAHNEQTPLTISLSQLLDHLGHNDTFGHCAQ